VNPELGKLQFRLFFSIFAEMLIANHAMAESFFSFSLSSVVDQKLTGIRGNENLNYPDTPLSPLIEPTSAFYPGTRYSSLKLKDSLICSLRVGHYFDALPTMGVEIEAAYSRPDFLRQNVTIRNPGFVSWSGQNNFTEDQLSAKNRLFQVSLDGLYRYQGFKDVIPYIGAGPSLYGFKISGTGYSGIVPGFSIGEAGPSIHETSTNVGANMKLGIGFRIDAQWNAGVEYKYDWVSLDISKFRSASNLNADYRAQSLSFVLQRTY